MYLMTEVVRVPDPVYERLEKESEEQDISIAAVTKLWMDEYYE